MPEEKLDKVVSEQDLQDMFERAENPQPIEHMGQRAIWFSVTRFGKDQRLDEIQAVVSKPTTNQETINAQATLKLGTVPEVVFFKRPDRPGPVEPSRLRKESVSLETAKEIIAKAADLTAAGRFGSE